MDLLNGFIVGLHLASVHVPAHDWQDNFNPGIYAQHVDTGITLGTYHNTLGRQTVYAGWTYDWGPASVTLGAATGYKKETQEVACNAEWAKHYTRCTMTLGVSKGALVPCSPPRSSCRRCWESRPECHSSPAWLARPTCSICPSKWRSDRRPGRERNECLVLMP
jgi:hypothetical protein